MISMSSQGRSCGIAGGFPENLTRALRGAERCEAQNLSEKTRGKSMPPAQNKIARLGSLILPVSLFGFAACASLLYLSQAFRNQRNRELGAQCENMYVYAGAISCVLALIYFLCLIFSGEERAKDPTSVAPADLSQASQPEKPSLLWNVLAGAWVGCVAVPLISWELGWEPSPILFVLAMGGGLGLFLLTYGLRRSAARTGGS